MKTYVIGGTEEFIVRIKNALELSGLKNVTTIVAPAISPKEIAEKAGDCEILVASPSGFEKLSKEHMDHLPKLKFISTTSVGTDWVDLNAAKEKSILVSNEKGVNAEAVAEHCFGVILDLAKRITEADRGIREKGEYSYAPYMGKEIYGKTLGIIGLGDIGQKVARIAKGFSMTVLGVNKSKKEVAGVALIDLETLLQKSDVIVVTVPLTAQTDNLLSEREFSLMKKGVILVSISREKIVNKDAVIAAVQSGKVFGFGVETEIMIPIEKDDPYLKNERILITPHTASMTEEADMGYISMTVENVEAFLKGKPIRKIN